MLNDIAKIQKAMKIESKRRNRSIGLGIALMRAVLNEYGYIYRDCRLGFRIPRSSYGLSLKCGHVACGETRASCSCRGRSLNIILSPKLTQHSQNKRKGGQASSGGQASVSHKISWLHQLGELMSRNQRNVRACCQSSPSLHRVLQQHLRSQRHL